MDTITLPSDEDYAPITDPAPFKVFGLQRTGTNLAVALMRHNFVVHSLGLQSEWKHGPLLVPDRTWNGIPARFVLCVKNPYAWSVSCYLYFRRAWRSDSTVAPQFQCMPSMSFDHFLSSPSYSFESPLHRWNRMYRLWLDTLPPDRTAIILQEDQIKDQMRVLLAVERQLGLTRLATDLHTIDQKVDVNVTPTGPMDRGYYISRQYMAAYPPPLMEYVNRLIDPGLMQRFGYEMEH